ncbi:nudix hydrolase 8 isoform X2 [Glycine max]|uniref:nudix hydrolase 8 isoform X2 n=1 Tax=Glycine max TaxID=3847 RepID=UPI001B356F16|nr:nudix hydrolase 8 isoform X2 [Glycine max]
MELKSFSSCSASTSEVVHVGRSYSTLFSSFRHKVGVRFSTHFKCRRGLFLRTYCASDNTYLTDKAFISSVGQDNFAAETSSHRINGTNGSISRFYSTNLKLLDAFDDEYGGVVVHPDRLPSNPYTFASVLRLSLSQWKKMGKKGIWLKLPLEQSDLVPIAVKVLVVQERHCSPATLGLWKIPTGFILEAEEIYTGAVREVKEETGIDTDFIEVIAFRHAHNVAFEKSDLFFICMLRPLSSKVIVDDLEIAAAKWMPLVEFVEQPLIQEDSMFKKIVDIFIARLGKRYCGLSTHQVVSKFDGMVSSLYYNVIDNEDNCVGK